MEVSVKLQITQHSAKQLSMHNTPEEPVATVRWVGVTIFANELFWKHLIRLSW